MKHKFSFSEMNKRLTQVLRERGEMVGTVLFKSPIQFGTAIPKDDQRRAVGLNSRKRTSELRYG